MPEPLYAGMSLPTLLKTLIISVLFIATFRFDLHRLWDKTNPFYGDGNWSHSFFVPLIGLWYLYVNRDQLKAAPIEPLLAGKFTRARFVSAGLTSALGLTIYYCIPILASRLGAADLMLEPLKGVGLGLMLLGAIVAGFDWGIGLLL